MHGWLTPQADAALATAEAIYGYGPIWTGCRSGPGRRSRLTGHAKGADLLRACHECPLRLKAFAGLLVGRSSRSVRGGDRRRAGGLRVPTGRRSAPTSRKKSWCSSWSGALTVATASRFRATDSPRSLLASRHTPSSKWLGLRRPARAAGDGRGRPRACAVPWGSARQRRAPHDGRSRCGPRLCPPRWGPRVPRRRQQTRTRPGCTRSCPAASAWAPVPTEAGIGEARNGCAHREGARRCRALRHRQTAQARGRRDHRQRREQDAEGPAHGRGWRMP